MPIIYYGKQGIVYTIHINSKLKSHYISVDKDHGVILKGIAITPEKADQLILKKARWILDKLSKLKDVNLDDIVTGSRIPYLGKRFYTSVFAKKDLEKAYVEFNYSKFKIYVNPDWDNPQDHIKAALDLFYKQKADEKISPRIERLSKKTKLEFNTLKYKKLAKKWGNCSPDNTIVINYEAVKLPFQLIDYLIIHELCHTKVKNHSKEFWALVSKHLPNYKTLDEKMSGMGL
jgi:predicted metal-dependent hydrolase